MAENRRHQNVTSRPLVREKKAKGSPRTYRFQLALGETTDKSCPEFTYGELLKGARREHAETLAEDPLDVNDEEQLQEIARRFEEKYGPKPDKKKKKVGRWEDYLDKGMGYDETDPFIDNEEAYDELVPSTLTTQYGGYYINCGELEFRTVSDSESAGIDDFKPRRKRRRNREFIEKEGKRRRRILKDGEQIPKKRGRKPINQSVSALAKPKRKGQPTVADMLQQHKAQMQLEKQQSHQELHPIISTENCPIQECALDVKEVTTQVKVESTITEAIESVVKAAAQEATAAEEEKSSGSCGHQTGSSDNEEAAKAVIESEGPKLPDNLPSDLYELVSKLKLAASNSAEGKCKFFSDEVNKMLLSVEVKSQEISSAQRTTIYSHLASHLPCTKETLQKRAKKLRLDQEDGKLREPMQKLKDAIGKVMAPLLEKYNAACSATVEAREGEKSGENYNAIGSEGEDNPDEERKHSKMPRKKFEWNDELRELLCNVVRVKLKCYEVTKTRIQSAEEYLKQFLEAEVKNLWPEGWIQSRTLFKESRSAHIKFMNKPKKLLMIPKKVPSAVTSTLNLSQVPVVNSIPLLQDVECGTALLSNNPVPSQLPSSLATEPGTNKDVPLNFSVSSPVATSGKNDLSPELNSSALVSKAPIPAELENNAKEGEVNKVLAHASNEKKPPQLQASEDMQVLLGIVEGVSPSPSPIQKPNQPPKLQEQVLSKSMLASEVLTQLIRVNLAHTAAAAANVNLPPVKTTGPSDHSGINLKEPRIICSRLPVDVVTTHKKKDAHCVKSFHKEGKKSSQISASATPTSTSSTNADSAQCVTSGQFSNMQTDLSLPNLVPQTSPLSLSTLDITSVTIKDTSMPQQPYQFLEAFERSFDGVEMKPKQTVSGRKSKSPTPSMPVLTPEPSVAALLSTVTDAEEPVNAICRTTVENPQRISRDLSVNYGASSSSSVPVNSSYKKRLKQSSKSKNQWSQYVTPEAGFNAAAILEGMKGFPFPLSPSSIHVTANVLPTPPPAHSSSHKIPSSKPQEAHFSSTRQHNPSSQKGSPQNAPYCHPDKARDVSGHCRLSSLPYETARRQSVVQGPWRGSRTQVSNTPTCQYFGSTTSTLSTSVYSSPSQLTSSHNQHHPATSSLHSQSSDHPISTAKSSPPNQQNPSSSQPRVSSSPRSSPSGHRNSPSQLHSVTTTLSSPSIQHGSPTVQQLHFGSPSVTSPSSQHSPSTTQAQHLFVSSVVSSSSSQHPQSSNHRCSSSPLPSSPSQHHPVSTIQSPHSQQVSSNPLHPVSTTVSSSSQHNQSPNQFHYSSSSKPLSPHQHNSSPSQPLPLQVSLASSTSQHSPSSHYQSVQTVEKPSNSAYGPSTTHGQQRSTVHNQQLKPSSSSSSKSSPNIYSQHLNQMPYSHALNQQLGQFQQQQQQHNQGSSPAYGLQHATSAGTVRTPQGVVQQQPESTPTSPSHHVPSLPVTSSGSSQRTAPHSN